jgi:hypothetical protein
VGEAAGGGDDALGGDGFAVVVDAAHRVADHAGVREVEDFCDGAVGGDAASGDLPHDVIYQVGDGGIAFAGGDNGDEAFFFLLWHVVKIKICKQMS